MPEVPHCTISMSTCDLWCHVARVVERYIPVCFGLTLWFLGRVSGPLSLDERKRSSHFAAAIGVGLLLIPPLGKALRPAYAWLAVAGFAIAAYLIAAYLMNVRHRVEPLRYWVLILLIIATIAAPVGIRGIRWFVLNPQEAGLLALLACLSAACAFGALALHSPGAALPMRFRVEAALGLAVSGLFLIGLYVG